MNLSPEDEAAFQALIAGLGSGVSRFDRAPAEQQSLRRAPLDSVHRYTLRIDLRDSQPPIWRRLEVNSDITLHTLHLAIQGAFDWQNYHLWHFTLGLTYDPRSELFLCDWEVAEGEAVGIPAREVRLDETLQQPRDLLQYVYDYGDNWGLKIRLESIADADPAAPVAVCVGGRRAAPPEDCGSLRTAEQLRRVLEDPTAFDLEDINDYIADYLEGDLDPWPLPPSREAGSSPDESTYLLEYPAFKEVVFFTPDPLDKLATISRLAYLDRGPTYALQSDEDQPQFEAGDPIDMHSLDLAQEFAPILWLLNRVGDGLRLTQAGYLPPAIAREFAAVLHSDEDLKVWGAGGESHLRQLAAYRQYLGKLGLLRKYRGMLLLTKAGAAARNSPELLFNHLADRFAASIASSSGHGANRDFDRESAALTLLHAATGGGAFSLQEVVRDLTVSGWGYSDGRPIHYADLAWNGTNPAVLLWFMGPREGRQWFSPRLTPGAVALAHAALTGQPK